MKATTIKLKINSLLQSYNFSHLLPEEMTQKLEKITQ